MSFRSGVSGCLDGGPCRSPGRRAPFPAGLQGRPSSQQLAAKRCRRTPQVGCGRHLVGRGARRKQQCSHNSDKKECFNASCSTCGRGAPAPLLPSCYLSPGSSLHPAAQPAAPRLLTHSCCCHQRCCCHHRHYCCLQLQRRGRLLLNLLSGQTASPGGSCCCWLVLQGSAEALEAAGRPHPLLLLLPPPRRVSRLLSPAFTCKCRMRRQSASAECAMNLSTAAPT